MSLKIEPGLNFLELYAAGKIKEAATGTYDVINGID
jgi:hypothetical protein